MRRGERDEQWKLVEHIVAALFDDPDVIVTGNVRLPAVQRRGEKARRREIDVLVEGRVAGQRILVPIECKHYRRKVTSPEIDKFIGKLQDVGLPTQTALFVSTSGFAQSAIERAQEVGMRALELSGASIDRTRELILEAVQSHIYVGCQLATLQFQSPHPATDHQDLLFFDSGGAFKGSIHDLLWQAWIAGVPPLELGEHAYQVEIPSEWRYRQDGKPHEIRNMRVQFRVFALVKRYRGEAHMNRLTDARTKAVERQSLSMMFEQAAVEQLPQTFETETDLQRYMDEQGRSPHLAVGRLRLPKLVLHEGLLWPVPSRVVEELDRFNPDEIGDYVERFSESTQNNFWDFDGFYSEVLAEAQAGCWIQMTPIDLAAGL